MKFIIPRLVPLSVICRRTFKRISVRDSLFTINNLKRQPYIQCNRFSTLRSKLYIQELSIGVVLLIHSGYKKGSICK